MLTCSDAGKALEISLLQELSFVPEELDLYLIDLGADDTIERTQALEEATQLDSGKPIILFRFGSLSVLMKDIVFQNLLKKPNVGFLNAPFDLLDVRSLCRYVKNGRQ